MSTPESVRVVHDGELDFVVEAMQELGIEYEELSPSKIDFKNWTPVPEQPLVTTAPRAAQIGARTHKPGSRAPAPRIAVLRGDSRSQTSLLKRVGFDRFIPERVHPAALRAFLAQMCFGGSNRRSVARLAFGSPIHFGVGLRRHSGVLVDLSKKGCGLLLSSAIAQGRGVTIGIPNPGGKRAPIRIRGKVVRSESAGAQGDHCWVGVEFGRLGKQQLQDLVDLLKTRRNGPAAWLADPLPAAAVEESPTPAERPAPAERPSPAERRVFQRIAAEGAIEAMCAGGTRTLTPLDLSEAGMLVVPNQQLQVSERVRLALQPAAAPEPLIIEARVLRADAGRGLALHFEWMEQEALEILRTVIREVAETDSIAAAMLATAGIGDLSI